MNYCRVETRLLVLGVTVAGQDLATQLQYMSELGSLSSNRLLILPKLNDQRAVEPNLDQNPGIDHAFT
jgi:hypothetical protein